MAEYTDYRDIDQEQLQRDIEDIKKVIKIEKKDFDHLLKLERWGRASTIVGSLIIALVDTLYIRPYPPVAMVVAFAMYAVNLPVIKSLAIQPRHRSPSWIKAVASMRS